MVAKCWLTASANACRVSYSSKIQLVILHAAGQSFNLTIPCSWFGCSHPSGFSVIEFRFCFAAQLCCLVSQMAPPCRHAFKPEDSVLLSNRLSDGGSDMGLPLMLRWQRLGRQIPVQGSGEQGLKHRHLFIRRRRVVDGGPVMCCDPPAERSNS